MEKKIVLCFKIEKYNCKKNDVRSCKRKSIFGHFKRVSLEVLHRMLTCRYDLTETELFSYTFQIPLEMRNSSAHMRKHLRKYVGQRIAQILKEHSGCDIAAILYDEDLETEFGFQSKVSGAFMLAIVRELMLAYHPVEEVVFIEGKEDALFILNDIYSTLNVLCVLTPDISRYHEFADEVYENAGLIVTFQNIMNQSCCIKGIPFVIDMCSDMKLSCRYIPSGTVYIDLCSTKAKQRAIQLKCRDVHYVNYWKFLDSY